MKKIFLILSLILSSVILVQAQAVPQTDEERAQQQAREADFNRRVDKLRNVGKDKIIRDRYKDQKLFEDKVMPIYRKPNKEEREIVATEQEGLKKYAEFLDKKDTGLTKLIIDRGCDKNIEIVVSTAHCIKYSLPGGGSSYSFRQKDYQRRRFADLSFSNNRFHALGLLTQGIFVDVGEIPIEDITMKSPALEFLKELEPEDEIDKVFEFNKKLEKGIEKNNFTYKLSAPLYENTTYILRSIAYRGEYYRTVEGITYNELDYDRRRDVTVAFRVVRYHPNEGITILWKILDDQKSPKLDLRQKSK